MKSKINISDQYLKLVEWSKEDQCYVGLYPGFIGPCCHGKDKDQVYKQLCTIVQEWAEIHQQKGIPLPKSLLNKTPDPQIEIS